MATRFDEVRKFHSAHAHQHNGEWAAEKMHQRAVETLDVMRSTLIDIATGALPADQAVEKAKIAIDLIGRQLQSED